MSQSNVAAMSERAQRALFQALGAMAPGVAAELALARFLTPPRSDAYRANAANERSRMLPDGETSWRPEADPGRPVGFHFRGAPLAVRRWGSGPGVLLVHGWGSTQEHFRHVIPALLDHGLSVVAFDAPAHGSSSGTLLDAMSFACAIRSIWNEHGAFEGAVGHSFGAACLLLSVRHFQLPVRRLVSVGAPSSILWLTEDFARRQGLSSETTRRMQALLETRSGLAWEDANLEKTIASLDVPTLFVHDELDPVVPYEHCERLATHARHSLRLTTRGRGHSGVLTDRGVIARLCEFLSPGSDLRSSRSRTGGVHG